MKKPFALSLLVASVAILSFGCTSSGSGSTSSWCRTGSLWPSSRTTAHQQVYYGGGGGGSCNPCEPACNPCEPACDPCAPAPCLPNCLPMGGILPSAGN